MPHNYRVVRKLSDGLLVLLSDLFGQQMWGKGKVTKRIRETRNCVLCEGNLGEQAYRPITNKGNRYERICVKCLELKP
jgi:hypothetical protein